MRSNLYLIFILTAIGCSNLSPNKYQIKSTKENLHCFQQLINQIQQDKTLKEEIIRVRNSKKRGFSPLGTKQTYRLITVNEIEKSLSNLWDAQCSKQIIQDNDFRGLRYINKDSIIIEVDEFNRKTLSERYSRYGTIEIHRIIIAQGKVNNRSFRYPSEKIKFIEKLENGWMYEVSQRVGN